LSRSTGNARRQRAIRRTAIRKLPGRIRAENRENHAANPDDVVEETSSVSKRECGVRSDFALQLMGELLLNAALISAPLLSLTLLVGLLVSILQAVTQVQEMSLTFVPKLLVAAVTLVLFGPWMLRKLLLFASTLIGNIPAYL